LRHSLIYGTSAAPFCYSAVGIFEQGITKLLKFDARAWNLGAMGFAGDSKLIREDNPGPNPGDLVMFKFVPDNLAEGAPLVVVLHGCGQNAAGYVNGTGWTALAERWGFALLVPEQKPTNNPGMCFNWFEPGDIERDRGEVASIRQMVEKMRTDHAIDPRRIYVTGLSAGGAMATALLATYPDVFAGGGIVAGLPYKSAIGMREAMGTMFHGRSKEPAEWGDLVRNASHHKGPWPIVSIWQGAADKTVAAANGVELANQWANVHGAPGPAIEDVVNGHRHILLRNPEGKPVVELYDITGMGHGAPIVPDDPDIPLGTAGAFILPTGISSTLLIARFWGLEPVAAAEEVEEIVPPLEIPAPVEIPAPETPVFTRPAKTGILAKLWKGIKRIVSRK
jgi:poly(hydroxyalkanoate) depolymerase family esterase